MNDNRDLPKTLETDVSDEDRLWAALAWIPISPIWPIVAIILLVVDDKRERPYIKYHAVLSLITGLVGIVLSFLCIGVIIWLLMFYFAIKAYQGERVQIPILTEFAENQGWV